MASDLTGKRFGRYVVIKDTGEQKVLCRCDCGNERMVNRYNLLGNKSHSCGCLTSEITSARNYKHGGTHTRLYQVWTNMHRRCEDPKNNRYKNYGGKGIKVCKQWDDFSKFRDWAEKSGYNPNAEYGECTLDRINSEKDYKPSNCRWATIQEQNYNRTSNRYITYKGEIKTVNQWNDELGFKKDRVASRIRKGWDVKRALETPVS